MVYVQVGEEAVLKAALMRPGDLIKVAVGLAKLVCLLLSLSLWRFYIWSFLLCLFLSPCVSLLISFASHF